MALTGMWVRLIALFVSQYDRAAANGKAKNDLK
jgi:hypothetical protein